MTIKIRILNLLIIGILSLSINACDRTSEITQPVEPSARIKVPVPTTEEPTIIQAKLVPCEPATILQSDNMHKTWQPIEPNQALGGIASISTGRVFDAAGYGYKLGISYAISKDGSAWFWGYAKQKQEIAFPQRILGLEHVQQISGSYALTTDGQVWLLKEINEKTTTNSPAMVSGMNDITAIQQLGEMQGTLYMLKRNGTIWQLKVGKTKPEPLSDFKEIRGIYGSEFSLFVLNKDGKLSYLNGRFGGSMLEKDLSIELPDTVSQIAVGYNDQALIQTVKGEMYIFTPDDGSFIRTSMADNAKRMAVVGGGLFLFVKPDGSVWGWGENKNGILGENISGKSDVPILIEGLADIIDIQAGTDHVLALDTEGHVFSWGSNMTGQLGRIPLIFDQWQEIGALEGIQQVVTQLEKPYFIRKDGSLWSLEADRTTNEVKGLSNIRMLTSVYGVPITLSTDGKVRIWSDKFASCQVLSIPFDVKQIIRGEESLLLQSEDNRFVILKVKPVMGNDYHIMTILPEKTESILTHGDWISQVKSLYSNQYTYLALTDDGKVYYSDKEADFSTEFKLVPDLRGIKALAPEYYVRYTSEPSSVWALNESGSVYEMIVNPVNKDWNKLEDVEVTLGPNKEDSISAISGRLRITQDGYIFEHDWSPSQRQLTPDPVRLVASNYSYSNEGPGSHYHLLVTNNNKLAIIGFNPFGRASSTPDKVILPRDEGLPR
jgi:hypothetical protein